ncbi:MAG: chloride channel protein [Polyangiaceae bacterium]|nr:chloride channel protein [Polyangiaceae bacterium]
MSQTSYLVALTIVALGAAAFAIAFRTLLSAAFEAGFGASDVVAAFERLPGWLRVVLPCVGGLLAGCVALVGRRAASGVGDVMEAVVFGRAHLSTSTTLLKSLGCWLAIVFGGSLGREGPLIQFGGSFGFTAGRWFHLEPRRVRTLIAAGTAAGFSAAYNTPLAAILFVVEVIIGVVALDAVLSVIVATAIATGVTRAVVGGGPIYGARSFALTRPEELILYASLGVVAALAAHGFMRLLSTGENLFDRLRIHQPWRAALGGLVVGLVALNLPQVTGNGYEPLNAMLDGAMPLTLVIALLVAKPVATTASVSSGSPGGVFTPTLFLGAAVGICFSRALAGLGVVELGGPGAYALVGMAATTAATSHAPIMAAVLVFELSGDYLIVLPLLISTAIATVVSRVLGADSIYRSELRRRGLVWEETLDGRKMLKERATKGA